MSNDIIRYDLLIQDALRGVVRKLLADVARNGLPGEHHFFISFKTGAPGVRLSQRMRERYPDDMRIVLQHGFWELLVTEQHFEVGLSFNKVAERVLVPFAAITEFFDPSVQFNVKFEAREAQLEGEAPAEPPPVKLALAKRDDETPKPAAKLEPRKSEIAKIGAPAEAKPPGKPASVPPVDTAKGPKREKDAPLAAPSEGEASKVVSIDAFRKKP